jgi:RNA polymerase sigma factor (sigma-70 family)
MPTKDITTELLTACIAHDRLAQRKLYEQFYGYAFNVCLRYSRNETEAGEMVNDGFLRVFKGLSSFRQEGSFKPWLKRVLINSSLNYLRKKQTLLVSISNTAEPEFPDISVSGLQYQDILGAIQHLPPMYRSVFNLYEIEGYSHQEISKVLKISAVTSRSNLMRAKTKLKAMLRDYSTLGKINYQV